LEALRGLRAHRRPVLDGIAALQDPSPPRFIIYHGHFTYQPPFGHDARPQVILFQVVSSSHCRCWFFWISPHYSLRRSVGIIAIIGMVEHILPVVWLCWSIIFALISLLSSVWRTGSTDHLVPIAITSVFCVGVVYFIRALFTLKRYGSPPEEDINIEAARLPSPRSLPGCQPNEHRASGRTLRSYNPLNLNLYKRVCS